MSAISSSATATTTAAAVASTSAAATASAATDKVTAQAAKIPAIKYQITQAYMGMTKFSTRTNEIYIPSLNIVCTEVRFFSSSSDVEAKFCTGKPHTSEGSTPIELDPIAVECIRETATLGHQHLLSKTKLESSLKQGFDSVIQSASQGTIPAVKYKATYNTFSAGDLVNTFDEVFIPSLNVRCTIAIDHNGKEIHADTATKPNNSTNPIQPGVSAPIAYPLTEINLDAEIANTIHETATLWAKCKGSQNKLQAYSNHIFSGSSISQGTSKK